MARGATEIAAPGRLDRPALAREEIVPAPGKEVLRPKAVICVDKSGSMKGSKIELAEVAAQAVALAVKAAGGEAVGILFDDKGEVADTGDDALLFFDRGALSYGGTDFGFLADAWRRWPGHFILLVTDGDGAIPLALPGDKARTAVILIPPDCDAALMGADRRPRCDVERPARPRQRAHHAGAAHPSRVRAIRSLAKLRLDHIRSGIFD